MVRPQNLTQPCGDDLRPRWSPRRVKIAMAGGRNDTREHAMNARKDAAKGDDFSPKTPRSRLVYRDGIDIYIYIYKYIYRYNYQKKFI